MKFKLSCEIKINKYENMYLECFFDAKFNNAVIVSTWVNK